SVLSEGMEITTDDATLVIGYSEAGLTQLKQRTVEQSIEVIRRRIDEGGTLEPTIIRQGEDRIVLQVPGVVDVEEVKRKTRTDAKLTFHMVQGDGGVGAVPPTMMDLPQEDSARPL